MKKVLPLLILLNVLFVIECSSTRRNDRNSRSCYRTLGGRERSNSKDISKDSIPKQDSIAIVYYNLIVSFSSNGSGINGQALKDFLAYIKVFEKFERTNMSYEIVQWGKEGEVDYCFKMEELYATQQERFKDGLKSLFKGKKKVTMLENKSCIHNK